MLGRPAVGIAMRLFTPFFLPLVCVSGLANAGAPSAENLEFFEKRVRPVLVAHCYSCHSSQKHKANLSLDSRAGVLKGGDSGPAIVPGAPGTSRLLRAISYQDADLRMPPKGKLSDEQIADLTRWIEIGAPWPENSTATPVATAKGDFDLEVRRKHWSLQPLKKPALPAVTQSDWPQSPVDRFVLARLEAKSLAPAPSADRCTLLRRVTFDLTGLPPTPAEVEAFMADNAPDAFEKVVDRLLASPHYGERWARHWLDLVRFAETWGHEFDFEMPEAYPYRDYLIRALNADVPYDQLVLEHVAGDLLARPRRHPTEGFNESILGTCFWYLGEAVHSPVDVRADEANRIDNQVDVLTKTFLGLTVACARCHDHKFDAISTKDYYALAGYLESSRFQRAFLDEPARTEATIRQMQDLRGRAQEIATTIISRRLQEQTAQLAAALLAGRFEAAATKRTDDPLYPWAVLVPAGKRLDARQFAAQREELVQRWKAQSKNATEAKNRAILFEDFKKQPYQNWFASGPAFGSGPCQTPSFHLQPDARQPVAKIDPPGIACSGLVSDRLQGVLRSRTFILPCKKVLYHVAGRQARINLIIDGYQLIREPIYGGLTIPVDHGPRLEWRVQDVSMWVGHKAYIEILDEGPGSIALDAVLFSDEAPPGDPPNQLLVRMLDDPSVDSPERLAQKYQAVFLELLSQWRPAGLGATRDDADRVAILNWMLESYPKASGGKHQDEEEYSAILEKHRQLEANLPAPRRAIAMADGTAWNERVHLRGNHKNLGEEIPRRFLEVLGGTQSPAPAQGSGRLELAQQMIQASDPLLPRVLVNRLWQHHFGQGIVASPDNFGVLGERPTHPELLDYLAVRLVQEGWSIKKMHRLMVLSRTYQMWSRPEEKADGQDPQNQLLHRMPLIRLEGEAIRDSLLAVSGRLDRRMCGPGVAPYLTPHMVGRGRPTHSGPLDGNGRRSIYLNVRRNFLPPLFLAFDYPIPFTTMGKRSVSNVPAQALALMNNPFVLQQAELWARRALVDQNLTVQKRITRLYISAFARPPSAAELEAAVAFLEGQGSKESTAHDLQAWIDLCHVLINVKEFIFIG
jgi:cytochrome c553